MAYQEDPKLLPDVIDEIAATEPESLYGKYPADPSNYDAGFKDVTYRQLANAINGVAQWLESEIGRGDPERTPTIAYIGPNDFRYIFAFVGAIKAGYKVRFATRVTESRIDANIFVDISHQPSQHCCGSFVSTRESRMHRDHRIRAGPFLRR